MPAKKAATPVEEAIERKILADRVKELEAKRVVVERELYGIMAAIGELKVILDPSLLDQQPGEQQNEPSEKG